MPKKDIKYENTSIYKIQHIEKSELLYVGHTTNFVKRKNRHKYICNCIHHEAHSRKLYQMIRDNGGWNVFKMLEVEKFPCADKREAETEEDRVMKELKANMNTKNAFLTPERRLELKKVSRIQYREKNKEILNQKDKEYRKNNQEKISERKREIVQCSCGAFLTRNNVGGSKHINSQRHKQGKSPIFSEATEAITK